MHAGRSRIALLLGSLGLFGCYASHTRGVGDGGALVPDGAPDAGSLSSEESALAAHDFVERVVRAWCEELASCPTLAGGEQIARADVDVCVSSSPTSEALRESLERYVEAVETGVAGFDPSTVAGCLDDIARSECASRPDLVVHPPPHAFSIGEPGFVGSSAACDAVFPRVLARAEGELCTGPLDCALGLHCAATPGVDACVRRCAPFARDGEPCSNGVLCAGDGGDLLCIDGHCAAPRRASGAVAGEACGWLLDPVELITCATGLACLGGACTPIEEREGAPCPVDAIFPAGEGCGAGLRCVSADGEARCIPSELSETSCASNEDATSLLVCDPSAGLVCEVGGHCRPMSAGLEGDTCSDVLYESCEGDLRCVDGRCARVGDAGDACGGAWDCVSRWCEGGVCQACDRDATALFYADPSGPPIGR